MPDDELTPGTGEENENGSENEGSQNTGETPGEGAGDLDCSDGATASADFWDAYRAAKKVRQRSGLSSGPVYQGDKPAPIVWFDQIFEQEAEPTGTVLCSKALRVGSTQNQLDIVVVASHANAEDLQVPGGATIEASLWQSDKADGTFTQCGPTVTATIPDDGFSVEPDGLVVRIPVGNMTKAWLKPRITFTGVFLGGTVDIALSLMPR